MNGDEPEMKFGVWPGGREITWKTLGFCVDRKKANKIPIYIFLIPC
jgi:hypothetical protein